MHSTNFIFQSWDKVWSKTWLYIQGMIMYFLSPHDAYTFQVRYVISLSRIPINVHVWGNCCNYPFCGFPSKGMFAAETTLHRLNYFVTVVLFMLVICQWKLLCNVVLEPIPFEVINIIFQMAGYAVSSIKLHEQTTDPQQADKTFKFFDYSLYQEPKKIGLLFFQNQFSILNGLCYPETFELWALFHFPNFRMLATLCPGSQSLGDGGQHNQTC